MAHGIPRMDDNTVTSDNPTLNSPDTVHRVCPIVLAGKEVSETGTSAPKIVGSIKDVELKLPLEIIDEILNAVVDRRDLKACVLSCSFFRQKCQSLIFRELTINCDTDGRVFREGGMVHTIAHEDGDVRVLGLIRRLKIENRYGAWKIPGGGKVVDSLLGKFVKKLKALEALEIHGTGLEWRHKGLTEGLIQLLQVPTLKELNLCDLEHFPMPLILWGRALKKIEIERVLFMHTVYVGFQKPPISPSLREFRMDNKEMGLALLWFHFLSNDAGRSMFSRLKRLRLEYRNGEGDRPDDIEPLLAACQDTLEDLVLFLTHEAYVLVALYVRNIRLDRMINLRSFSTRLYLTTRDGYLAEDHPFKLLTALFSGGSSSLQKIRLTFFHRFGDQGDENAPEASGWNDLDLALASLSKLRQVSVMVCCTQCTPDQMEAHKGVYDLALVKAKGVDLSVIFTDNITLASREEKCLGNP